MSKIRAVAFDANGVLYYRDTDVVDSVITVAKSKGASLPLDAKERYEILMKQAFGGAMTRPQMVEEILDSWQIEDPTQRGIIADAITEASRVIRIYPKVVPTLARLRELGIETGVITNTFQSSAEKWMWFEKHGLAPYLGHMISSIEAGVAKPDPEIYRIFVNECGLTPDEVVFVGHDLGELLGAQSAGLVCVAYRPDQPGTFQPEFQDFPDLLKLIGVERG